MDAFVASEDTARTAVVTDLRVLCMKLEKSDEILYMTRGSQEDLVYNSTDVGPLNYLETIKRDYKGFGLRNVDS